MKLTFASVMILSALVGPGLASTAEISSPADARALMVALTFYWGKCEGITGAIPTKVENGWTTIAKIYGVDLDNPLVRKELVDQARSIVSLGDVPNHCAEFRKLLWK